MREVDGFVNIRKERIEMKYTMKQTMIGIDG